MEPQEACLGHKDENTQASYSPSPVKVSNLKQAQQREEKDFDSTSSPEFLKRFRTEHSNYIVEIMCMISY